MTARDRRRTADLVPDPSIVSDGWLIYDPALAPFRRVEDRAEIDDLMDRANLSGPQRAALWFSAVHASDGPPPKGHEPLGSVAKASTHRTAVRRIRKVIAGNTLNDDWAAARAQFQAAFEVRAYKTRAVRQGRCVVCGEVFDGKRADAKYCSEACKRAARPAPDDRQLEAV